MLHAGILPNHKSWAAFLQRLDTVVIDEAHTYRGVFGSHVSLLLRRLRRVCARYGAEPRFILCSATIGNPMELAENLTGEPFTAVTDSGAPLGEKRFLFWNPPLRDAVSGVREKAYGESARLLAETTRAGVRTIAFVRTRRTAELVFGAARDMVAEKEPALANRLAPYRAHYMAEDRRRIEEGLREGVLLGVAATNALELGMDIGGLDATVLTGYPGSVASAWQQAGRGGRRGEASLAVLVARDDPLDQYLMRHPEFFHGRPMEHALIAPENPYVLAPHLLCAAHEFPLTLGDRAYFGDALPTQLDELVESGHLRPTRGRWHLDPTVDYPAQHVHLRSTSDRSYTVVDGGTGALLEAGVEASAAYSSLYPGAIYLHQGEPFLVTELNIAGETAVVTAAKEPYYTQSRDITDIRVLNTYRRRTVSVDVRVALGEVEVTRQVVAYRKLAHYTEANLGDEILDLPAHRFRTVALWFEAPPVTVEDIIEGKRDLAGGLHAAEHAAIGVLPLFALCDRADIGGVSTPMHVDTGVPHRLHLRRLPRRHRHCRARLRGRRGALAHDAAGRGRVPLQRGLPRLRPVPQVRQQQPPTGQGRRGGAAAGPAEPAAGDTTWLDTPGAARGTLEVRRMAAGVGIALALLLSLGYWSGASGMLDQHFLYFPTGELIGSPADYGIAFEDVYFDTRGRPAAATGGLCRARAT